MAIFSTNKDLDSTIAVVGIHVLMGACVYFHSIDSLEASVLNQLMIAYTGVCGYLFGKGKAEAEARKNGEGPQ